MPFNFMGDESNSSYSSARTEANPNDPQQQYNWAQAKTNATQEKMSKYADYLMGPQRRGQILGQNFRVAGLQRGAGNEYVAGMAAKGITNPAMASRFLAQQERDLTGQAFTSANQQTNQDMGIGAGILGQVYQGEQRRESELGGAYRANEERKANEFGWGDAFKLMGVTTLGAVTGGVGGALASAAFGATNKFFGGGGGSQFGPSDPTSNWEPKGGYQSGDYSSFKWE